jgi:uncharacterized protein YecE (DUF72 family)
MSKSFYIGCAGWNLRKEYADHFPTEGTHLERYSGRLDCVEINSSFYRSHRASTYQRWSESTPEDFRFAVKLPKAITHINRLIGSDALIEKFATEIDGLGPKLGVILVQLPPSLAFDHAIADSVFRSFVTRLKAALVCEPRHPTWFTSEADSLLTKYRIGRVAADPSVLPLAAIPGGCRNDVYFRWHGSPRMYYSEYDAVALRKLASQLENPARATERIWCVFDNTASGAALNNAVALSELLERKALTGAGH